jgi:hypothetical protein
VLESSAKAESGHRVVAAAEGTDGFGFLRRMMTSAMGLMGHGACWASMREARAINSANGPGKRDERRWATGPKGRLGLCQFGRKREIGSAALGLERLSGRNKRNEFLGCINCFF